MTAPHHDNFRLPLSSLAALTATLILAALTSASAQEAKTDPVGVVKVEVNGGAVGDAGITMISIPMFGQVGNDFVGTSAGALTTVDADNSTVSVTDAGWPVDALAADAQPYFLLVKSGDAAGRLLLITGNTISELTLDSEGIGISDLSQGTKFEIIPGDTLLSFFGTPEDGIIGGSTGAVNTTDVIRTFYQGAWRNYFYNTASSRWEIVGSPFFGPQNDVVIRPDRGCIFFRVGSAFSYQVTGRVATSNHKVIVNEGGADIIASNIPVDTTLGSFDIENMPNWKAVGDPGITSSNQADICRLFSGGAWRSLYYNRTSNQWFIRGLEFFGPQNTISIKSGSSLILERKGATTASVWEQQLPYQL